MKSNSIAKLLMLTVTAFCLTASIAFAADDEGDGHGAQAEVSTDGGVHAEDNADGGEHGDDHSEGDHGHGPADATANNPLSINIDLAIVTAVVFLLLLAILKKFAWGPISEALVKREQGVADNIEEARRQNEEAKQLLSEHKTQLANAAAEVKQMLEEAKRDAESQKQTILAEAQSAAAAEKNRAIREIDTAKNAALQSLAEKSVDTAVGLAGKIVGSQLSAADHSQLINEALENFPSDN
ncbi:MAG: F0F1 ATP synthase subunit B [Planctomycetales bacterium]|nr:F0F1 ATP synthase subunit B [Planctomycetales bacterium]